MNIDDFYGENEGKFDNYWKYVLVCFWGMAFMILQNSPHPPALRCSPHSVPPSGTSLSGDPEREMSMIRVCDL